MRILADFKCKNEHYSELYLDNDIRSTICPVCDAEALKQLSAPTVKLDPISGDFPGATMKWARVREKQIKHERKGNS